MQLFFNSYWTVPLLKKIAPKWDKWQSTPLFFKLSETFSVLTIKFCTQISAGLIWNPIFVADTVSYMTQ